MKIIYSPNSYYDGSVNDNCIPDGIGFMQYDINETYKGEFKMGLRNGKGIYTYKSGSYYDGEWKDDKRNGKGTFYNIERKWLYIGTFQDDVVCEGGCFIDNYEPTDNNTLNVLKETEYDDDNYTKENDLYKTPTKNPKVYERLSTDVKSPDKEYNE